LSMGGFAALHFGLRYPELAESLVVAGCGYGAEHSKRAQFTGEATKLADGLDEKGMAEIARIYGAGPTRVQLENKDPRGYEEFLSILAGNSAKGSALTMRGVQAHRPSIYDLEPQLRELTVPTLLILGDEDEPCLDVNLYMKRIIPSAGLVVLPQTGHACNIEEPDAFNAALREFFLKAEQDRWGMRDPRSVADSILTTR
jgi:pimeloyl-ACP methyl ester carboxylesterase